MSHQPASDLQFEQCHLHRPGRVAGLADQFIHSHGGDGQQIGDGIACGDRDAGGSNGFDEISTIHFEALFS